MTRSSGEYADSRYGDLAHDCGHDGYTLWHYDPVVSRDTLATTCPGCGVDVERPTSEGIF